MEIFAISDCGWILKIFPLFVLPAKCSKFVSPYKKVPFTIIYFTSTLCKNQGKNQEKFRKVMPKLLVKFPLYSFC